MKLLASLTARVAAAFAFAFCSAAGATAQGEGDMRLSLVKIMDPSGFEKPMAAATTVLPADWTTQGGVIWRFNMDSCNNGQSVDWIAKSGDGKAFIQMSPSQMWQFNNQGMPVQQGCVPASFRTADEYVAAYISQMPNARVTGVERSPEVSQVLAREPFSYEFQGDPYSNNWMDAAVVSVEFDYQGERYAGSMVVWTSHNYTVSGHSYGFGQALEMGYGMALTQIMMAAPKDDIADYAQAFQLFMKNYRNDPEWSARMAQHNRTISEINRRGLEERGRIMSKTYSDLSDASMKSWRERDAASDRGQRATSEWIRDVETYDADTPTGQIELPTGYDRAFQMNDGSFVVTNDAFYDPMDGRQLNVSQ